MLGRGTPMPSGPTRRLTVDIMEDATPHHHGHAGKNVVNQTEAAERFHVPLST